MPNLFSPGDVVTFKDGIRKLTMQEFHFRLPEEAVVVEIDEDDSVNHCGGLYVLRLLDTYARIGLTILGDDMELVTSAAEVQEEKERIRQKGW